MGAVDDEDFKRRARLSVIWQDLVTPVRAIVGYQEIIVEQGERLQLVDIAPFLNKVLAAAGSLSTLVDALENGGAAPDPSSEEIGGIQARLRHDLRTPLNAIIGYSELVLEEIEGAPAAAALRTDVERLLAEAHQLLGRIDAIVDLTRPADPDTRTDAAELADAEAAIAGLMRTLRPDRNGARTHEIGRILVVDDKESNRDLLCRRLSHEGHDVEAASSGRQALTLLEGKNFDLILLDLLMPDMNGIEVLERLKSDERWQQTPVIMISGLSERDAVIRCIEAGAEDYLPKPFNLVLLRARINACLERQRWREREQQYLAILREEKNRSDELLRNILPVAIIGRLNNGETIIADRFESASILFADIVGFTPMAASMSAAGLVSRLDRIFSEFDRLAGELGVEKIKTIGDAYMAASGLPEPSPHHAESILRFAMGMLDAVGRFNAGEDEAISIRIGVNSGPVVAGIIGRHKFIYDVWGDTVNVASRLETQGVAGRIQVSDTIFGALSGVYDFEPRGNIMLKGRGRVRAFLLVPASGA